MRKMPFGYLFLILIFFLPVSLGAFDFGLLINQYAGLDNSADGDEDEDLVFEYRADVIPRVEFFFGDTGNFFTSASMTLGYRNKFYYVPELLRTEFSIRFGSFGIRAGRFNYSDPLSLVANGLFDGVQFTLNSSAGRFSLGAWYTGLLYKKNINITMTEEDFKRFNTPLNYSEFTSTYFAPRRLVGSIDWEHPSLGELVQVKTAITGQMDFSKENEKYHSQYLTVKVDIPVSSFMIEAGGSFEVSQSEAANEDLVFNLAFAGDLGFYWTIPTSFNSRLSFSGRYASGDFKSDRFSAFVPITTKYYGEIFQTKMSAVSVLSLNYSARFFPSLGASLSASYFIRNDLITKNIYVTTIEDLKNKGHFLGSEFFANLIWNPFSDLQLNLGGGTFIPSWGNRWQDEKLQWRIDLKAILSVY